MEDLINARCGWAGTDELYLKYHDERMGPTPLLMTELYLSSWYSKVLRQDYPGLLSFESVKDTGKPFIILMWRK